MNFARKIEKSSGRLKEIGRQLGILSQMPRARQGDPMSTFRLNIMEQGRGDRMVVRLVAALLFANLSGIARPTH